MREPESWKELPAGFGDRVRIRSTSETEAARIAGLIGVVYGITTVSVTGVKVVGDPSKDIALNVHFEGTGKDVWVAPHLVEFLDHDPGATITLDGVSKKWVRDASGEWVESSRPLPVKEWPALLRNLWCRFIRR